MRWSWLCAALCGCPWISATEQAERLDPCDTATSWAPDGDGDGWGDATAAFIGCDPPEGWVDNSGDCDDADPAGPGIERCGGCDEDCDGFVDEAGAEGEVAYYLDLDGDGLGDPASEAWDCEPIEGYILLAGDCDDGSAAIPAARDLCDDGIDNDCDGTADGPGCWRDTDGDGLQDSDPCPEVAGGTADFDGDGVGDACDNCLWVWNESQADADDDGWGDACDFWDNGGGTGDDDDDDDSQR